MKKRLHLKFKQSLHVAGASALMFATLGNTSAQTNATQRIYANLQQNNVGGLLSSVTSPNNAVDGNSTDSAFFATGVLGSATQYLEFTSGGTPVTVKAGTPIYIKFSTPTSVLSALQGLTIAPFTNLHDNGILGAHNWVATNGQPSLSGSASLLSLLGGAGTNELKVVPQTDCNGVSISLSGINVGVNFGVFSAYYLDTLATAAGCPKPVDVLSGVNGNGINAANITSFVSDGYNAIDGDTSTAATINLGANVLSQTYLTAILNSPAKAGDSVKILLQDNGTLLTVNALTNFKIVTYNGSTVVDTLSLTNNILSISLLNGTGHINVLKVRAPHSFDRVGVVFGGLAGVNLLSSTKIYEISTSAPAPKIMGQTNQYAYHGNAFVLNAISDTANDPVIWTDISGNQVNVNIPATQAAGNYTYYAFSSRNGCTTGSDTTKLNLHIVSVPPPADPIAGTTGQAYSADVTIPVTSTGMPNTPHYVYSVNTGVAFNFNNSANNMYALNTRFTAGPAVPNIAAAAASTGLPDGLSLSSEGTISGTTSQSGDFSFTMHVEDDANKDAAGNNLVVGDFAKTLTVSASLPITLVPHSFTASLDNDKDVVLSWKTASEINASKFDVQSSTNGSTFTTIGSVKAQGNSSTEQSYHFTDKHAAGLTYYRLVLVDLDNSSVTAGDVISINNGKQSSVKIFPNPATTSVTINADVVSVKVFDASGKTVFIGNSTQVDVSRLSKGIYFITAVLKDGSTFKSRIIKE